MDLEIVNRTIAWIRDLVSKYNAKLEALTPEHPPHWAPNIQQAGKWLIRAAGDDMIRDHFIGKRYRGKAHEKRVAKLEAEIKALPEWQAMNAEIADSLIGGREKFHERFGLTPPSIVP